MNEENIQKNSEPLTPAEEKALVECVALYQDYEHSAFEAGRGLLGIRDGRLYRKFGPTFEFYCQENLGCSRDKADRLIWAWSVYQLLTPIGVELTSESQARELMGFTRGQVIDAGQRALKIAGGKKLTAKHFRLAADQIKAEAGKRPSPPKASSASAKAVNQVLTKAVEQVLTLVSAAEAAVEARDYAKVRENLDAIKACLAPPHALPVEGRSPGIDAIGIPAAFPAPAANPAPIPFAEPSPATQNEPAAKAPEAEPDMPNVPKAAPQILAQSDVAIPQTAASDPELAKPKKGADQPVTILIGDSGASIARWYDVPLFIANWLLKQGTPLSDIPFVKREASAFPASARLKPLRDGSFIELGDDRAHLLKKAHRLLDGCGHRGMKVAVKLSNGKTIAI